MIKIKSFDREHQNISAYEYLCSLFFDHTGRHEQKGCEPLTGGPIITSHMQNSKKLFKNSIYFFPLIDEGLYYHLEKV